MSDVAADKSFDKPLRRGWTTGACATAAARAAFVALHRGATPDPVEIALPSGQRVAFALRQFERGADFALAGVVKDAGDDPDVTHGATIFARVSRNPPGVGVTFRAGEGVGVVTRPGLPLAVGEPAINPVPRAMMRDNLAEAARELGVEADALVEISIPGGEEMAKHTLNGRLGIVGGLSVLGTTGIVVPYSCAAWIDSIHRGVDVARACGLRISPRRPAPRRKARSAPSMICPRRRWSKWAISLAGCSNICTSIPWRRRPSAAASPS